MKGAIEAGHRVEKIVLRDKRISCCTGGYACETTHACVQDDDMEPMLGSMVAADAVSCGFCGPG